MRTPILAGNWKMHMTVAESVAFVNELAPKIAEFDAVERVVCPTFVALAAVADALKDTPIKVGAQNIHWEDNGAFTSQIAPNMLAELVDYAIIGHSEVRAYLGDTDEMVNKKAVAALSHGINPIIAIGESLAQREAGEAEPICDNQTRAALAGISGEDVANKIVIAYEPIWAIGTGKTATAQQANDIIGGVVRKTIESLYGGQVADAVRIQYGGSMKPGNIAELMAQPDIDGGLVGGASLKVDDFTELVRIAAGNN